MRVLSQRSAPDAAAAPAADGPAAAGSPVGAGSVFAAGDCASVLWPNEQPDGEHGDGGSAAALWFQMRLWSQARTQGFFAALCMAGHVDELDGGCNFELFAHASRFFGHSVVLLGRFNGQGLPAPQRREVIGRVVTSMGVTRQLRREGLPLGAAHTRAPPQAAHRDAGPGQQQGATATSRGADQGPPVTTPAAVELLVRVTPGVGYAKLVLQGGSVQGAMLIGEEPELAETFENLILDRLDVGGLGLAEGLLDPRVDLEDFFD